MENKKIKDPVVVDIVKTIHSDIDPYGEEIWDGEEKVKPMQVTHRRGLPHFYNATASMNVY